MGDTLKMKQETTLQTELGQATAKVPSLMKRLEIERKRSLYMGGLGYISNAGVQIADMFATLDVVMVECEKLKKSDDTGTWDYESLPEYEFDKLEDVYKKVQDWLDSFRKRVGSEQKEVGQG